VKGSNPTNSKWVAQKPGESETGWKKKTNLKEPRGWVVQTRRGRAKKGFSPKKPGPKSL